MSNIQNVNVDKIKALSSLRGITLKSLNEKLGKNRSFLSNVKSGSDKLDESELSYIANELGTTIEYLTDISDDPENQNKVNEKSPSSEEDGLSPEKQQIMEVFKKLNPERQRMVLEFARILDSTEKDNK